MPSEERNHVNYMRDSCPECGGFGHCTIQWRSPTTGCLMPGLWWCSRCGRFFFKASGGIPMKLKSDGLEQPGNRGRTE